MKEKITYNMAGLDIEVSCVLSFSLGIGCHQEIWITHYQLHGMLKSFCKKLYAPAYNIVG